MTTHHTPTTGVFLYHDYVKLLPGDIAAAMMLSRIVYWYLPTKKTKKSKLQVQWQGTYWLVKSHRDWFVECGFTPKQARRCLKKLEVLGLICTEVHRFAGAPTVHVRLLLAKGASQLATAPSRNDFAALMPQGQNGFALEDKTDLPSVGANDLTYTTKDTNYLTVPSAIAQNAITHGEASASEEEQGSPDGEKGFATVEVALVNAVTPETPMNAKDVLASMTQKKSTTLAGTWQALCAEKSGGFQKPLTGKELGQISHLKKILGDDTEAVMTWAVTHWSKFGMHAAASGGLGNFPIDPQLGFLLKYCAVAVDLWKPPVQLSASSPGVVVASESSESPPQTSVVTETPHIVTKEELAAMLGGLKE